MTVKDIIKKYLEDNGYDGLSNGDPGCGCPTSDFMPCDGTCSDCNPAYVHESSEGETVYCSIKEIEEMEEGHCIGCEYECRAKAGGQI